MKLSDGLIGNSYIVDDISLNLSVRRRLEILGMTHGAKLTVLGSKKSGPMMIKVRGTRFALGRSFCDGISVRQGSLN